MPGPARTAVREGSHGTRVASPGGENAGCVRCHQTIAREWESSLHRHAADEPDFRSSLALEPLPFCRGCHAPEGDATRDITDEARALGVACVTCHATVHGTLASNGGTSAQPPPHAVVRSAAFTSDGACAGCHEFRFPDSAGLMQSTVKEHRESSVAARSCADCHMPRVGEPGHTHRSHAFEGSRSEGALRAALRADATRVGSRMDLLLAPVEIGHAFPTGDLFRRLHVIAEVMDGENVIDRRHAFLMRSFSPAPNGAGMLGRAEVMDTRLTGPRTVSLELGPPAAGRKVSWRVSYERVSHPRGGDPRNAALFGSIVLAQGTL
jgi:hypothetical protein